VPFLCGLVGSTMTILDRRVPSEVIASVSSPGFGPVEGHHTRFAIAL
jgi:hypothetical protein